MATVGDLDLEASFFMWPRVKVNSVLLVKAPEDLPTLRWTVVGPPTSSTVNDTQSGLCSRRISSR
ncbi:hypothetical protein N7457_002462 [Penicillium paradoxum]|uniref:uncharacterized protein n=1 Tax=Penicillium paradoxum TaxID=176176 RepID=UPI002546ED65|nr:uncharacterized protein N7457_002462 [Penicillium paradoxum]KAJ5787472.1 hypothetical protein N7457_002462 [Penicillium paradoxum]